MSPAYPELNPSPRLLLGPGPSSVHPRVLRAMATPLLGYMDPEFLKMLDETREMLRYTFHTNNELTLPVSGTGMSGMEAVLGNLLEPGDKLLVSAAGFFGNRLRKHGLGHGGAGAKIGKARGGGLFGNRLEELALRHGVAVAKIERPWGEVFTPEEIEAALKKSGAKAVALVHAETSTGAP